MGDTRLNKRARIAVAKGRSFFTEEAYGTPVVVAAAGSINFRGGGQGEETSVTPLVADATWQI